jgi:hypothetical protein
MRAWSLPALLLLAACSDPGSTRTERFWAARQEAVDPPQLWSVEAVPAQAGWRPVLVCADRAMRQGFARPLPAVGTAQCDPVEDDARTEGGVYTVRCDLNGRRFGVSSVVTGDVTRDFVARYQVTDLAGFMATRTRAASEAVQSRRYRKLGACPAGWTIGDRTDRFGARLRQALVAEAPQ